MASHFIYNESAKHAYDIGKLRFILSPNDLKETVCKIGDNWFYFGGMDAENRSPSEYLSKVGFNKAIDEVCDYLNYHHKKMDHEEFDYYAAVIDESEKQWRQLTKS